MATLYLHIGTPKTGTTAIQHFCVKNRRELQRRGFYFPQPPAFYPTISKERNGFFLTANASNPDGSFATPQDEVIWRKHMRKLAEHLRRYPNVVLSDEGIWNRSAASPGLWKNLKEEAWANGYNVHIIAYLRRQDQFLTSVWAQQIKFPPDPKIIGLSCEEALSQLEQSLRLDYYSLLEEIAAHFGRENMTVRVYDRERFPGGDVRRDFLEIIGLQMSENFEMSGGRNPSLHGNALEIVRIVNTIPGIPAEMLRSASSIALNCCAAEREGVEVSLFSGEELARFMDRYAHSNRLLVRDYLGGEDALAFAPLPREAVTKWEPGGPEMYETIIRFFATAMFSPPKVRLTRRIRRAIHRQRVRVWQLRSTMRAHRTS